MHERINAMFRYVPVKWWCALSVFLAFTSHLSSFLLLYVAVIIGGAGVYVTSRDAISRKNAWGIMLAGAIGLVCWLLIYKLFFHAVSVSRG